MSVEYGIRRARRVAAVAALALAGVAALPSPLPAEGPNLAAAGLGARVIKYTSQLGEGSRAERIIDDGAASGGWAAADASLPQEIVIRLPDVARFNTLVFQLDAGAPEGEWARDVSVYTAEPFPTMGGWKLVDHVRLERRPGDQAFSVAGVDGRFVRLLITAAQSPGAARVTLGRFKLFWR